MIQLENVVNSVMIPLSSIRDWRLMAASKFERKVYLWRLSPRVKPKEASQPATFAEIMALVEAQFLDSKASVHVGGNGQILDDQSALKDDKNQLYLADFEQTKDYFVLLFNRGDPTAANPSFISRVQSKVRPVMPTGDEVLGYSAHLVIAKSLSSNSHRAVFEKMSNVSGTLVLNALDRIVARAVAGNSQYTYVKKVKTGKGKEKKLVDETRPYFPSLEVNRVPSENLLNDLAQGRLTGVRLTKTSTQFAGVLQGQIVKRAEHIVKISTADVTAGQAIAFINDIISYGKVQNYESVTFELDDLPGGQSNHPTISLDTIDAVEELYVRAQRLADFKYNLENCYAKVCDEIRDKMLTLLSKNIPDW